MVIITVLFRSRKSKGRAVSTWVRLVTHSILHLVTLAPPLLVDPNILNEESGVYLTLALVRDAHRSETNKALLAYILRRTSACDAHTDDLRLVYSDHRGMGYKKHEFKEPKESILYEQHI